MSSLTPQQLAAQKRNAPILAEDRRREADKRRHERFIRRSAAKRVIEARACMGPLCGNKGGYAGLPYCKEHAYDALAKLTSHREKQAAMDRLEAQEAKQREAWKAKAEDRYAAWRERDFERRNMVPRAGSEPGVVYYLNVGGLIKIGWTADLVQRLRSYPPHAELLAVHPGTLDTEKAMHRKFGHLIARGREWFTPHESIDQHIAEVIDQFGPPNTHEKRPAPGLGPVANRVA